MKVHCNLCITACCCQTKASSILLHLWGFAMCCAIYKSCKICLTSVMHAKPMEKMAFPA